jgi:hypothetical protein
MAAWRRDGQPRTARRDTTDQHGPLPPPEDRRLCMLVYLQTSPLQVVQGRRFGRGQSQAQQWSHVLLVILPATRRVLGEAPTRAVAELAQRLGVAAADATALVVPTEGPPTPAAPPTAAPTAGPIFPLLATMAPHGASRAPRPRLRRRAVIAARKRATRCSMCS